MSGNLTKAEILASLLGAWRLVEWSEDLADGGKDYPLGPDAIGQILYSPDGHVAAQLARADPQRFRSGDWREASAEEGGAAFKSYFGYFGRFSIDLERQAVIHHVEGSWFPNLASTDQVRRFRFENGRLVLDADTDWGKVRIVWERSAPWSP